MTATPHELADRSGDDSLLELTGYVTAFVDLLGLGRRLESLERLFDDSPNEPAVLRELQASIGQILRLRRGFKQMFFEMSKADVRPPVPITSAEALAYQKLRSPEVIVQYLSDAVVLSVRVHENNPQAVYIGILRLLHSIGGMTVCMLSAGQPCRGGIELGTGLAINEFEVLGSALVRAHRIERCQAVFPRTVIGDRLLEFLRNGEGLPLPPKGSGRIELATECLSRLSPDIEDGRYFIDFLAPWCTELFPIPDRKRLIASVRAHIETTAKSLENTQEHNVSSKYRWLQRYSASRLGSD